MKSANSDGRFWIKLDGTDVKKALMESQRKEWNGDVDLGNGQLQAMRAEYDSRLQLLEQLSKSVSRNGLETSLKRAVDLLDADVTFLSTGFAEAVEVYLKKFNTPNTREQTLKNANWEVVEHETLLEEAQSLKIIYERCIGMLDPNTWNERQRVSCKATLKDSRTKGSEYLRNLFKKKRVAADHIVVIMVSDEKRNKKPYALPVKFIPCTTLRDQFVRDLNREVKTKMTERGLLVVGKI